MPVNSTRPFGIIKKKGRGYVIISTLFFLICAAIISPPGEATGQIVNREYLLELKKRADEKKLSENRYWHVLLHYKRNIFGLKSLIDDPRFFLSSEGKYDPKKELHATLDAFFMDTPAEKDSAVCRFMARYNWLKKELAIDESKLPRSKCVKIEETIKTKIMPESVSLVFPASHINSPASMFGHTLMTIDQKNKDKLLSLAVNYSAFTGDSAGLLYAFRGIFGLYKGYFGVFPYYKKIREYSDFSYRDIWEYTLNLRKSEMKQMIYHLFELDRIYSYYYFFDENCSYNILYLLDVAREGSSLTDEFYGFIPSPVTPVNTIRSIMRRGFIKETVYRPSHVTRLQYISSLLDRKARDRVHAIANREEDPAEILDADIPRQEKMRILDLAIDVVKYRYNEEEITRKEYMDVYLKTLAARSRVPEKSEYDIPRPVEPEKGHYTSRIAVGAGMEGRFNEKKGVYQELRFRPTYHTFMDPAAGFVKGGQIVFLDAAARYYPCEKLFILEKIDLMNIISLSPSGEFTSSLSWKIITGLRRMKLSGGGYPLIYGLNPGWGVTADLGFLGYWYVLAEVDAALGPGLNNWYTLGAGATAGILNYVSRYWTVHLMGRNVYYATGERNNTLEASLTQSFHFGKYATINIGAGRTWIWDWRFAEHEYHDRLSVFLNIFF